MAAPRILWVHAASNAEALTRRSSYDQVGIAFAGAILNRHDVAGNRGVAGQQAAVGTYCYRINVVRPQGFESRPSEA